MKKLQPRQMVLLALLAIVGIFFFREYFGDIRIPTNSLIQERLVELESARADLKFVKQNMAEREKAFDELNALTSAYWVPANAGKIEQEINAEISKILRRANVQATQKVDATRERNGSFLQEVYVTLQMKSVSMQAITRFFKEFGQYRNAGKFRWESCKIGPDNARAPKGVNVNIRFKVLTLNDDALKLINGEK